MSEAVGDDDLDTLDTSSSEDREGADASLGEEAESWESHSTAEDDTLSLAHKGSKIRKQEPFDDDMSEAVGDDDLDTLDTSSSEDREGADVSLGEEAESWE